MRNPWLGADLKETKELARRVWEVMPDVERWPASSKQRFALDKWRLCRLLS